MAETDTVAAVRRFNRFYTRAIGVLDKGHLGGPYSLAESRVLYEIASREGVTPKDIIARLSAEVQRAVRDPAVNGKLTGLGLEVIADTPEQFAAFLEAEAKQWLPIIRKLNIKLD